MENLPHSLSEMLIRLLDGPVAAGTIRLTLDDHATLSFQFRGDQIDEVVLMDGNERVGTRSLELTAFLSELGAAMRDHN